jgi:hypothetical protein
MRLTLGVMGHRVRTAIFGLAALAVAAVPPVSAHAQDWHFSPGPQAPAGRSQFVADLDFDAVGRAYLTWELAPREPNPLATFNGARGVLAPSGAWALAPALPPRILGGDTASWGDGHGRLVALRRNHDLGPGRKGHTFAVEIVTAAARPDGGFGPLTAIDRSVNFRRGNFWPIFVPVVASNAHGDVLAAWR